MSGNEHPCHPFLVFSERLFDLGTAIDMRCGNCGTAVEVTPNLEVTFAEILAAVDAHCLPPASEGRES